MLAPGQVVLSEFRAQPYNSMELTCKASQLETVIGPFRIFYRYFSNLGFFNRLGGCATVNR